MAEHNYVGQLGESLAKKFLEDKGYKILEQNYKTKYAEIDLVVEQPQEISWKNPLGKSPSKLVFVEVRTKVGEQFGTPEDTLDRKKLWKVLQNASTYTAFKRWEGACRIDAICIVLKPDYSVNRLTHHENIIS